MIETAGVILAHFYSFARFIARDHPFLDDLLKTIGGTD
jgi:hypothetical protein